MIFPALLIMNTRSCPPDVCTTPGATLPKTPKAPSKILKPLTAYNYFAFSERKKIKEVLPKSAGRQVELILKYVWATITEEKLRPFKVLNDQDRLRYEQELENAGLSKRKKRVSRSQSAIKVSLG
jgi:hypothetical protein